MSFFIDADSARTNTGDRISEHDVRPRNLQPTTLAQWAERMAIADTFAAAPSDARLRGALFVERRGAVVGYGAPGIASLMTNRIFVGGEGEAVDLDHLDTLLERFDARGVERFFVHVHEQDVTPDLQRRLAARGIVRYRRAWLKLLRGPGELQRGSHARGPQAPITDLRIAATRHEDAERFAQIAVEAMELSPGMASMIAPLIGRPSWHAYMAFDGDVPVAIGMLLVRGDVGYLSLGATLPAWRGRGAQSALLDKRMRVAFALGCRRVVAETGEALPGTRNPSLNNMLRLGMQVVGRRDNFVREGSTWR